MMRPCFLCWLAILCSAAVNVAADSDVAGGFASVWQRAAGSALDALSGGAGLSDVALRALHVGLQETVRQSGGADRTVTPAELDLRAAGLSRESLRKTQWRLSAAAAAVFVGESDLRQSLKGLDCSLRSFSRQDLHGDDQPQWFVCERRNGDLVVSFRPTMSAADALTDLQITPEGPDSAQGAWEAHSGFLEAARRAWHGGLDLELTPSAVLAAPSVELVGSSLGGALVLALLVSDLLPQSTPGKYVATTFGAPAIFYGGQPRPADLRRASVEQWVLEDDPVPRLLGSNLPALRKALDTSLGITDFVAASTGLAEDGWWAAISNFAEGVVDYSEGYQHLGAANVYWLRRGQLLSIPPKSRGELLTFQGEGMLPDIRPQDFLQHPYWAYAAELDSLFTSRTDRSISGGEL